MIPADRLEIERLIFSYARFVDTTDYASLGALFVDGAIKSNKSRDAGHTELRGSDAIRQFYSTTNRSYGDGGALTHHVVTNLEFGEESSAEIASVRSCFTVFQRTPSLPLQPIVCGRYQDQFRKTGGQWHYVEKYIEVTLVGDISQHLNIPL